MLILSPESEQDFERYFDLRWRLLRKPWKQPRGSERDELDAVSWHRMACLDGRPPHIPIGVARLHLIDSQRAQLRYMAVEPDHRHQGIGRALEADLEALARANRVREIILQARADSVPFYQQLGYSVTGPGHLLYGEIRHFAMRKCLD